MDPRALTELIPDWREKGAPLNQPVTADTFLFGQLLQADRGRQAAGAGADDHHVVFHGFAGTELGEDFVLGHRGCR